MVGSRSVLRKHETDGLGIMFTSCILYSIDPYRLLENCTHRNSHRDALHVKQSFSITIPRHRSQDIKPFASSCQSNSCRWTRNYYCPCSYPCLAVRRYRDSSIYIEFTVSLVTRQGHEWLLTMLQAMHSGMDLPELRLNAVRLANGNLVFALASRFPKRRVSGQQEFAGDPV